MMFFAKTFFQVLSVTLQNLNKWISLATVLWGCVNKLKMNVLTRLIYLLHNLPIIIPQSYFVKKQPHAQLFSMGRG